jgi:hypothetical protein
MTFYVNVFYPKESNYNNQCVGLFTRNTWEGRGNCCGWYGAEYYLNTTLLAYGIHNSFVCPVNLKAPFDGGVTFVDKDDFYEEIRIGGCYWEKRFEANSFEEAREIFMKQAW